MKAEKQKELFLRFEADNWYNRNKSALADRTPDSDELLQEILRNLPVKDGEQPCVLEIGCGNGLRLQFLQQAGYSVCGLDPSQEAVSDAMAAGIDAQVGTADELPFERQEFDAVVFGFCLYLCDREDLFRIAAEADRVLKNNGLVFILDFYAKQEYANDYHHLAGVKSYKMDYSRLFDWHPDYHLVQKIVANHAVADRNEWTAISVIRKMNA